MVKVYEFQRIALTPTEGSSVGAGELPLQMAQGAPDVAHTTSGAKTAEGLTQFLKIVGEGSITWPNGVTEDFSGVEFRGVARGQSFTINA